PQKNIRIYFAKPSRRKKSIIIYCQNINRSAQPLIFCGCITLSLHPQGINGRADLSKLTIKNHIKQHTRKSP
ncbi:MAG: hypothetical protein K5927_06955, partial [Lachnospiraceae bacterium]|nr:hypothetical protein [Lachnospiraceae bacterium]